jgi:hypothetical protein
MPDDAENELFGEMHLEKTLTSGTFPHPLKKARSSVCPALCTRNLGFMQQLDAARSLFACTQVNRLWG